MHRSRDIGAVLLVDIDAHDARRAVGKRRTHDQTGLRAAARCPVHDRVDLHVQRSRLRLDLAERRDIAERPDRIGTADRHDIGLAARANMFRRHLLQLGRRLIVLQRHARARPA